MNEMEEKDLAQLCKQMLGQCIGYDGDELAESRKQAYDYYFQRPRGDEVKGRSTIVSGDVSAMVEGNLAKMVTPLLAKRIVEFCAYDASDEEQAQLESDCVKEMLFERENGFIELTCAIKNALLLRNAVVKVYVDERTHKQKVRRENVTPEIVTDVLDQIGEVTIHKYDQETGKLSATVEKTTRRFRVEAIAPENFLFPKNWHRQDLDGIPFCAERHCETRATLIERGFDKGKVAQLRRWNNPYQAATDARLPRAVSPHSMPIDKSQELVEWYECYALMDDGEGASELHVIAVSDQWILDDDTETSIVGYATGVVFINPNTFMGISLFDKMKAVQDRQTALERALQDNLNATNKNRTASLNGIVEEQDLNDGRTNGNIRVNPDGIQDVRQAIMAFGVVDTSANILANLENGRRVRSEMGGATLDMASGQMQLSDRLGSQGLDRVYSVMEELAEFMTRMFAHTLVRTMYKVGHEVLRTQWGKPIQFKRGKQWIQTDPSKWQVRDALKVNMGMTLNERIRIANVLDSLMNKQVLLAQNGMEEILVDVQAFYNALMDWLRVNDIEVPEKYLLDPRTDTAKAAFQKKAQEKAAAAQKQDAMVNQAIALEQLRTAFEKYKHDSQLQFDYYAKVLDVQVEEAKLTTGGVVDLTKARSDAQIARKQSEQRAAGESSAESKGQSAAK